MPLGDRIKRSFNAFFNRDPTIEYRDVGVITSYRPDRPVAIPGAERSIVTAICTRISIDVAQIDIEHVRLDRSGRFKEEIVDGLDNCLRVEANIDQTGRSFIYDSVYSMLNEGVVALVPTDTTANPNLTDSYDILEMRVGEILQWYPDSVKVRVYNERTGKKEDIRLKKSTIGIVENPLYAVMNEPNSTLKRLVRTTALLDSLNSNNSSGKLDMIIQLPYTIKTEKRRQEAEDRRKDIEMQLAGSKYGIAYADATEKITQLNRPLDNNLQAQIDSLKAQIYAELGLSENIMNGTASEQEQLNYMNRSIEPILNALCEEIYRKFLSKTARSQGQAIRFFKDPFKLVPINNIADIADKFTRNAIMSSNEMRQEIGLKPVDDPDADALRNKNLNQSAQDAPAPSTNEEMPNDGEVQDESLLGQ